ncbi:MAG: type VI secretion system ATPase TssH, partial [Rhodobacterales bacterium]
MAQRGSPETVKRKELVGKLNEVCLRAFSAAAQSAKTRGNPYVELAHFVEALSRSDRSDFDILCQSAGVDGARLEGDLQRALDKLPHGAGAVEEFSDHIFHAIREAWTFGKMEREADQVRSAHILMAAMKVPVLEGLLLKISLEFDKIDPDSLEPQLDGLLEASVESTSAPSAAAEPAAKPQGKSALAQYAT